MHSGSQSGWSSFLLSACSAEGFCSNMHLVFLYVSLGFSCLLKMLKAKLGFSLEFLEHGVLLSTLGRGGIKPCTVSFTAVISAFAKIGVRG